MSASPVDSFLPAHHGITEHAHRLKAQGSVLYTAPAFTHALLAHALREWSQSLSQLIIFRTANAVRAYYELELYWGLHCLAQELPTHEQEAVFTRLKKHYDFITEEALRVSHLQELSGEHKKDFRRVMHSLAHYSTALQKEGLAQGAELSSVKPLEFEQALKYKETLAAHPRFGKQKLASLESFRKISLEKFTELEEVVALREQSEVSLDKLWDFHATYRAARASGLRPIARTAPDPAIYSKMKLFTHISQSDLAPDKVDEGLRAYERHEVIPSGRTPWAEGFVEEFRRLYSPFAPQHMRLYRLAAELTTQLTQQRSTEFRTLTVNKLGALLKQVVGHTDELALYSECLSTMKVYRKRTTASVLSEETFEEFEVRLEAARLLG